MTERADRAVEVLEWRAVVALTEAAARAAREAPESYERRKRTAEDVVERQVRGHARGGVARWAAGVLADPNAVVLSFATAGSGERVDALEVALLDTGGGRSSTGARADRDPAEVRPRLQDRLREALAPTGEGRAQAGSGRRVVVFDRPPVLRLLARHAPGVLSALSRATGRGGGGPGEGDAAGIEDARTQYYRAYGEWNISTEDYCSCTFLPGRDDTALGDARATLALVKKLEQGGRDGYDHDARGARGEREGGLREVLGGLLA